MCDGCDSVCLVVGRRPQVELGCSAGKTNIQNAMVVIRLPIGTVL